MLVQKYGGATLATPEKILQIAKNIADLHQKGESLIVVVSAMGKTTDELMSLAHKVSNQPNRRELDMLLTTGERISMALMSMALVQLGRPAISFTGSQAGVFTDASHSNAHILDIKPHRVEDELQRGKIVVLAGFQGVNPKSKEITTLGRGGSDTTAVAMASHFKAKRCEILKDVSGVYSADPNVVSEAKLYKNLLYQDLTEMCWWGAKVLHSRSADLAWKLNMPLFIGLAVDRNIGTVISEGDDSMYENKMVLAINSLNPVEHIQVKASSTSEAIQILTAVCSKAGLPLPKILASTYENGALRMMIYGDSDLLHSLHQAVQSEPAISDLNIKASGVSLTGPGIGQQQIIEESLTHLNKAGINVLKILNTPRTLTFIVKQPDKDPTTKALHSLWL